MNVRRISPNDKRIKVVVIRTAADIKKAIAPFIKDVKTTSVEIKGKITWNEVENGKTVQRSETITAQNDDINRKEVLIEGFNEVKRRKEAWDTLQHALIEDAYSVNLPNANIDDMYMSVDKIIKHRLAGKREGLTVVWRLNDGKKYIFDPYTSQLTVE